MKSRNVLDILVLGVVAGFALGCGDHTTSLVDTDPPAPQFHHRPGHSGGPGGGDGGEEVAGWALFNDGTSFAVRSDGNGTVDVDDADGDGDPTTGVDANGYSDTEGCLTVNDFQVRTVSNTDACKASTGWRFLTFDFGSQQPIDLDQNGSAEQIEEAPVRFTASDSKGKLGCGQASGEICVRILVLEVLPDGTTSQETVWALEYQSPVPVGQSSDGVPLLTMPGGSAAADVCDEANQGPQGNQDCPIFATVDLPFRVTWQGLVP